MPGKDIGGSSSNKLMPRYSTRKSLWKAAMRASAFLTWSLASLTSAQALMTSSCEKGISILEIGDVVQSVAAVEVANVDIAEPLLWTELHQPGGPCRLLDAIENLRPNLVWIQPPKTTDGDRDNDDLEQACREVHYAVKLCGERQVSQDGALAVDVSSLTEEGAGSIRTRLVELGSVSDHHFDGVHFTKR